MSKYERLTDEQWMLLSPLIPPAVIREDGKGRPLLHDDRAVMDGVLWVLRTGASWCDLPDRFPSSSTCYRRFSKWVKQGVLRNLLETLACDLEDRGGIDLENAL